MKPLGSLAARLGFLALLSIPFLMWELTARQSGTVRFFFSAPTAILADLVVYARSGELSIDLLSTTEPAFAGLAIGAVIGGVLGFALAAMPRAARFVRPVLAALAAFPIFILAPMTLNWFAAHYDAAKIFLAFVSCVFLFLSAAYSGGQTVPSELLDHLQLHGFGAGGQFRRLRLPFALDWLLESLRSGANLALLGVFIGEYVVAEHGLAKTMILEAGRYNMARAMSAAFCFTLVAWLFSLLALVLRDRSRQLLRWISVPRRTRKFGR